MHSSFETNTIHCITYTAFEDLMAELYPFIQKYDFVTEEESHNDICHMYHIENVWNKWDEEEWENDVKRDENYSYCANLFLHRLCKDGHIEPGTYLIEVYW